MNPVIDLILHRRSVRSYEADAIPDEMLDLILKAGCAAPFGGPEEPWKFLVIKKQETKDKLFEACKGYVDRFYGGGPPYHNTFFVTAPVVIAVLFKPTSMGDYDERTELGIGVASAACAIENMILTAASLGLGTCWVGPKAEGKEDFERILGVQKPWEFLAFVPIGKPREEIRRDRVKPLGQMVEFLD